MIPFRKAQNDIVWVIDSNVHTSRGTLARSVDALTQKNPTIDTHTPARPKLKRRVGVVHHRRLGELEDQALGGETGRFKGEHHMFDEIVVQQLVRGQQTMLTRLADANTFLAP